jgi:hypothetical protein
MKVHVWNGKDGHEHARKTFPLDQGKRDEKTQDKKRLDASTQNEDEHLWVASGRETVCHIYRSQ